jgi:hypothetical protein
MFNFRKPLFTEERRDVAELLGYVSFLAAIAFGIAAILFS